VLYAPGIGTAEFLDPDSGSCATPRVQGEKMHTSVTTMTLNSIDRRQTYLSADEGYVPAAPHVDQPVLTEGEE
jgi:hypothetical protein